MEQRRVSWAEATIIVAIVFGVATLTWQLLSLAHSPSAADWQSRNPDSPAQQRKADRTGCDTKLRALGYQPPARDGTRPDDAAQKHYDDLCQQIRSVEVAEDAIKYARRQWWLAAISLGLVFFATLAAVAAALFTRSGAKEAKRQADAAIETVEEMRRISEAQLRPHVLNVLGELRNFGVGKRPQAHVIIKNTGLTPAYDLEAWIGIALRPSSMLDEPAGDPPPSISRSILAPSADYHLTVYLPRPLTEADIASISNGRAIIHVIGGVNYFDFLAKARMNAGTYVRPPQTRFRYGYGGLYGVNETHALYHAAHGNEAT